MSGSQIRSSYNRRTRVLTVTFRNGVYNLPEVPAAVADAFKRASSKGTFWNRYLKGKY